jgi:hypothetical protein
MSDSAPPLIQVITPERWAGWSMDFIGAGYVGLLVKNGQLIRKLEPGRHFSFAIPWLEQCQLILVDSKIRNLAIISQGDFVSRDQYLVNVSLSIMYQVIDPKRIALELSDPIAALTSAVKDNLGVVLNEMQLAQLIQNGRVQIRQHLLSHLDSFYLLGFNLEDVRVSDISFPKSSGVVRQIEGLTSRQEAEYQIALQTQPAHAERFTPSQQKSAGSSVSSHNSDALSAASLPNAGVKPTMVIQGHNAPDVLQPPIVHTPVHPPSTLPATTLAADVGNATVPTLKHQTSGRVITLTTIPFTIGREPYHHLVSDSPLCSRNHARIEKVMNAQGVVYQVIDMGSSNGTFVNNQRLVPHQSVPLKAGSVLKIGTDEWVFVDV